MQKYLNRTKNKTKVFETTKKHKNMEMNAKEQITNLILDLPEDSRFYEILKSDIQRAKEKQIGNISSEEESEDEIEKK